MKSAKLKFWDNWSEKKKELYFIVRSWDKHTCISKYPGSFCEALKDMKLSKSVSEFHCLSYVKMLHLMKINQDNFPFIDTATVCSCTASFTWNGWCYHSAFYWRVQISLECMRYHKIIKTNGNTRTQTGRNQWGLLLYTGRSFRHTHSTSVLHCSLS